MFFFPVIVFDLVEQVVRIGKCRHPAPVDQPGVPADMIGMQMSTHDDIDVFRGDALRAQIIHPRPFLAMPVRPDGPVLVVADAGIDQDGQALCPDDIAPESHDDVACFRIDAVRLQPAAVPVHRVPGRIGIQFKWIAVNSLPFHHAADGYVADFECAHASLRYSLRQ